MLNYFFHFSFKLLASFLFQPRVLPPTCPRTWTARHVTLWSAGTAPLRLRPTASKRPPTMDTTPPAVWWAHPATSTTWSVARNTLSLWRRCIRAVLALKCPCYTYYRCLLVKSNSIDFNTRLILISMNWNKVASSVAMKHEWNQVYWVHKHHNLKGIFLELN